MHAQRKEQLVRIIDISERMLQQARAMEWTRVAELEAERKELVAECFRQPAVAAEAGDVAESIRTILRLNDEITALGRDCRAELGGKLQARRAGHAASAAYLNCAR